MSLGDADFVSLYYDNTLSVDEDEFSELAANCVVGVSCALSQRLERDLILDRNCTVSGVYVRFDSLNRELSPVKMPQERQDVDFGTLLHTEPHLALGVVQTALHTLVRIAFFIIFRFNCA